MTRVIVAPQVRSKSVPMTGAFAYGSSVASVVVMKGYPGWQQPHLTQSTLHGVSTTLIRTLRSTSVVVGQHRSITPTPAGTPRLLQHTNHGTNSVNVPRACPMAQRTCPVGSTSQQTPQLSFRTLQRRASRSCLLNQASHSQTSGSWAPEQQTASAVLPSTPEKQPQTLVRLSRATRAASSPLLPVLAQRDKVSKAPEQLKEGSINEESIINVQQDTGKGAPVPADTDEKVGFCKAGLIQAEDCGGHVPAVMPITSTTKLTEAEDCGDGVPALAAVEESPTSSTVELTKAVIKTHSAEAEDSGEQTPKRSSTDLTEAFVLTQDSMPVFVEVRHEKAQGATKDSSEAVSLCSSSSGGKRVSACKDLPEFNNCDGVSTNWFRNSSWSHSQVMAANVFEPLRKTGTPQKLRRGRTTDLEVNLSACKKQLEQLRLERKEHDALTAQSPDQQVGTHPLLDKASSLSARLTDLAAEALECGCNRDVPGAMDVYEEANASLDTVSDLLQSFTAASMHLDEEEEETGDAAWPPLDSYKSDDTSPGFGLSRFLRSVGS